MPPKSPAEPGNGSPGGAPPDLAPPDPGKGGADTDDTTPDAPSFEAPDPLAWQAAPYDTADAAEDTYALEARAETLSIFTRGDAVRRGKLDEVRTGKVKSLADEVGGQETVAITGKLTERADEKLTLTAERLETTVHGRMSVTAAGWPGGALSGEDTILLGGTMTDTWTGGVLIGAAMSDDLVVGGGVRITSPIDIWLNGLMGMEERPGTAAADGVFVDLCGTLFEREYGAGLHAAGVATFSGQVFMTQRTGFWPLMKVGLGVRNLIPGAGGAAGEAAPPAPPAAPPTGAAEGAMVVTGTTHSAATSVRGVDNFDDMTRVVSSADEMEDVNNLRHAESSADTLDALADSRNLELPNETPTDNWVSPLSDADLQRAQLLDGVDLDAAVSRLDGTIDARLNRIEEGIAKQVEQINDLIVERLDEIGDAVRRVDVDTDPLPTGAGKAPGEITSSPTVNWPGTPLDGTESRRAQLEAEVEALTLIKSALDTNEDPAQYLSDALARSNELYGASDPRTQAYADAVTYYGDLAKVGKVQEFLGELDFQMLARTELAAGRDPRVALQAALDGTEAGSDAQRYGQSVLGQFNRPSYNLKGKVPEGMDVSSLDDAWRDHVDKLRGVANSIDTSTPEGAERAQALKKVSSTLTSARLDMRGGANPTSKLLDQIRILEAKTFLDGFDGAGEASILRAAMAEYASYVEDFRSAAALADLDDLGIATRVGDGPPPSVFDDPPPYSLFPGQTPVEAPPSAADIVEPQQRGNWLTSRLRALADQIRARFRGSAAPTVPAPGLLAPDNLPPASVFGDADIDVYRSLDGAPIPDDLRPASVLGDADVDLRGAVDGAPIPEDLRPASVFSEAQGDLYGPIEEPIYDDILSPRSRPSTYDLAGSPSPAANIDVPEDRIYDFPRAPWYPPEESTYSRLNRPLPPTPGAADDVGGYSTLGPRGTYDLVGPIEEPIYDEILPPSARTTQRSVLDHYDFGPGYDHLVPQEPIYDDILSPGSRNGPTYDLAGSPSPYGNLDVPDEAIYDGIYDNVTFVESEYSRAGRAPGDPLPPSAFDHYDFGPTSTYDLAGSPSPAANIVQQDPIYHLPRNAWYPPDDTAYSRLNRPQPIAGELDDVGGYSALGGREPGPLPPAAFDHYDFGPTSTYDVAGSPSPYGNLNVGDEPIYDGIYNNVTFVESEYDSVVLAPGDIRPRGRPYENIDNRVVYAGVYANGNPGAPIYDDVAGHGAPQPYQTPVQPYETPRNLYDHLAPQSPVYDAPVGGNRGRPPSSYDNLVYEPTYAQPLFTGASPQGGAQPGSGAPWAFDNLTYGTPPLRTSPVVDTSQAVIPRFEDSGTVWADIAAVDGNATLRGNYQEMARNARDRGGNFRPISHAV